MFSALFFIKFVIIMKNNKQNENQRPSKMINIAFPKAKYGLYVAFFIIIIILLILYKDLIL